MAIVCVVVVWIYFLKDKVSAFDFIYINLELLFFTCDCLSARFCDERLVDLIRMFFEDECHELHEFFSKLFCIIICIER